MANLYKILKYVFFSTIIPGFFILLWLTGLIAIGILKVCLVISFILFVVIPFLFKYSIKLQQGILFLTFIAQPSDAVLRSPENLGLYATRNFYVTHQDKDDKSDIHLGVWHVLPNYISRKFPKELKLDDNEISSLIQSKVMGDREKLIESTKQQLQSQFQIVTDINQQEFYEQLLRSNGSKIILYLHGNTGSRAAGHRVELYKILRELGYHVIALDYRNYADSSSVRPTELGVVNDAIAVYNYIRNITKNPVFVWGHSLGTGILTHMMATLKRNNVLAPRLVVLESPFDNIRNEVREHPISKLFRHLPWFNYTITDPMYENHLRFESDKHIAEFRQPIIIVHAEDDLVVPFKLGFNLYHTALEVRKKSWGPIEFHRFEASSRYGHKYLCRAPELPAIITTFIEAYQNEVY